MKEKDRIEGAKRLQSLLRVRDEATPIINKLSQVEASGKREIKFEAFSEALGKLPFIVERLKATPKFEGANTKELREIQELEERALDAFINSCELRIEQLKQPKRFRQSKIMFKVSRANGCWQSSARKAIQFLRK